MKKFISLFIMLLLSIIIVKAEEIPNPNFEDYNFYKCLIDNYNTKNNKHEEYSHILTDDELATITNVTCSGKETEKIISVKGIEKLTNLTSIDLSYNNITSIDVKSFTELTELLIYNNKITNIDLTKNSNLRTLSIYNNELSTIELSNNPELTYLSLTNNNISNIDLTKNTKLTYLSLANNKITNLDLSQNSELTTLYLFNNQFMALNLIGINKIINKDNINFTPQVREFNLKNDGNQYVLNLKEFDNNLDPEKVKFNNIDGVTYDKETGIFTFTKEIESISYIYKTGLPVSSELSEDMEVKLNLKYTNNFVNNYVDQKGDQVQTGALAIGFIVSVTLLVGLTCYMLVNRYNKLYKL